MTSYLTDIFWIVFKLSMKRIFNNIEKFTLPCKQVVKKKKAGSFKKEREKPYYKRNWTFYFIDFKDNSSKIFTYLLNLLNMSHFQSINLYPLCNSPFFSGRAKPVLNVSTVDVYPSWHHWELKLEKLKIYISSYSFISDE